MTCIEQAVSTGNRLVLVFMLFVSSCSYLAPPPQPRQAIIVDDKGIRRVSVEEAIRAVGFEPIFPSLLPPNASQEVRLMARVLSDTQPEMELMYTSKDGDQVLMTLIERSQADPILSPQRTEQNVEGTRVFHGFVTIPSSADPTKAFVASWNQRGIQYDLMIGISTSEQPTDIQRVGLEIVKSLITAVNEH